MQEKGVNLIECALFFLTFVTFTTSEYQKAEILLCEPEITITSNILDCYKYNEVIEITYSDSCLPINAILFVYGCSNNSCFDIDPLLIECNRIQIELVDPFTTGESYYIRFGTKNYFIETESFLIGERSIVINPLKDLLYKPNDVISIDFIASCFPPGTKLLVVACYGENCFKLGSVLSDIGKLEIVLKSPFALGVSYTINIQSEDGYLEAVSDEFIIDDCDCPPLIEITSPVQSCYVIKDVLVLTYKVSCVALNSDLLVILCSSDNNCNLLGVTSTKLTSVNLKLISPFRIGQSYYVILKTKNGSASARTEEFLVSLPEIDICSETKECYNPNDIININFKTICLTSDSKLKAVACQEKVCSDLGYLSSDDNEFQVKVYNPLNIGGPYKIFLQTKDGYVEDCFGSFIVGKPSIVISPLEDCYNIGEKITLTLEASCFNSPTKLKVLVCKKLGGQCEFLTFVYSNENSVDIEVDSDFFTHGYEYYFEIRTEDGYSLSTSSSFEARNGNCNCKSSFTLTSQPEKECYDSGTQLTLTYTADCYPNGATIPAKLCDENTCFKDFEIEADEEEFSITLESLEAGINYHFEIDGGYGVGTIISYSFTICPKCKPSFSLTSQPEKVCYTSEATLILTYTAECYDEGATIPVKLCDESSCFENFKIDDVLVENTEFTITLPSFLEPGVNYHFQFDGGYGVNIVSSYNFRICGCQLTITQNPLKCYKQGDTVTFLFEAICEPEVQINIALCKAYDECIEGYASVESSSGTYELNTRDVYDKASYYLVLSTINGMTQTTSTFTVGYKFKITSTVDDCYVYGDPFSISYECACPPDDHLWISACSDLDCRELHSIGNSKKISESDTFILTEAANARTNGFVEPVVSPLILSSDGTRLPYHIIFEGLNDGTIYDQTDDFFINGLACTGDCSVSTYNNEPFTVETCYEQSDIITITFNIECYPAGIEFYVEGCQLENDGVAFSCVNTTVEYTTGETRERTEVSLDVGLTGLQDNRRSYLQVMDNRYRFYKSNDFDVLENCPN
ncbi:hypothetical protein ACFFRR_002297 [Megaselia abdita]